MDSILKGQAETLANELAAQVTTLEDLNGLMRTMMKTALERILNTEMDVHLQRRGPTEATNTPATHDAATDASDPAPGAPKNRRNGHSQKTVGSDMGEFTLRTPRDRNGTFEPQLIAKGQRRLDGFDEKILALYAKGMTTRDIQEIVKDLYGVDVSPSLVSEITADLDAEVTAWRTRRLDAVWPIVYLDGIVVHVRDENGRVSQHTMYVAIGVNVQGRKELLGRWLGETEGAKFWLSCLTDLKERGVEDMFIVCVDGLSGFPEAIRAAFPQTKVQLCIIHLVRAALRYTTETDSRDVASDLKTIYQSATVLEAEEALEKFAAKWDQKYPTIARQWRAKWGDIITLFDFPGAIRKAIYTTNAIESVNSVIRKFTRNRKQCPNAERVEAGVPGDSRGIEEVDDADRGVEGGVEPLRHRVRGPHAHAAPELTATNVPDLLTQKSLQAHSDPARVPKGHHPPGYQAANVSITLYDGEPVPKVIDFGVAKAAGQQTRGA